MKIFGKGVKGLHSNRTFTFCICKSCDPVITLNLVKEDSLKMCEPQT